MKKFEFIPNEYAVENFGVKKKKYVAGKVSGVLKAAFGRKVFKEQFEHKCSSYEARNESEVTVITNREAFMAAATSQRDVMPYIKKVGMIIGR